MASQVNICNLALRRIGERTITAIDEGTKMADHCNAFWDYILDEVLNDYAWKFTVKTVTLDYTAGFGVYSSGDTKTITDITQASPAVVSVASHGLTDGIPVYIYDVAGMTEVNERVYEIADVDTDSFQLVGMDSTGWTAYTSGGSCYHKEADPKYSTGYTYDLPSDCLKPLKLQDVDYEFEIVGSGSAKRLLTTQSDAILTYTILESTTTNMVNRFISAMAYRLASELCVPLAKKGIKAQEMLQMYSYILGKNSSADARGERKNADDSDPWLDKANLTV